MAAEGYGGVEGLRQMVQGAASSTPRGGVKTPPYDAKDKGDAKRTRELTQGCGPGMPGPYGLL